MTRCAGGSLNGSGWLRHLLITTRRKSGEEKTSLEMCSGNTSTAGMATSHTQVSSSVNVRCCARTSHIRTITVRSPSPRC